MDWHWLWLTVAAFLAGVLNAVAGGGSFLLFPAMLSMKMLPVQANATNTVAIWPGQLTSIAAYRHDIGRNLHLAWPMGLAGLLGGTAGAVVLLNTPQMTFLHLVPWLLLVAASIFAASGPVSRWLARRNRERNHHTISDQPQPPRRLPVFFATIFVSFYIGYFGAGAGFLLIMANGIAFIIFVADGQVVWRYCLLAMLTCAIGGYTSASMARRVPQSLLRAIVVFIGLSMAAWFFWRSG